MQLAYSIVLLAAIAMPAHAEDRSVLVNCRAMVERASKDAGAASEAELARCRQVIREWALRDARMIVDEQGRPLR
ncbi:hypothetical protein [Bradyrhizobium iriomotense]|uniref:Uncharacterized protein n=1 Tax=Bradyrhizobium iriomotense TaxID=441950 RepID=A0ABQ6B606_9BRAD|nr:hypothetical protein [Bradyrhizobium iriomotense]GLR89857.1 hypothetical protein GCM10007857_65710 [Bradyrhizobium iriomotense]